MRKAIRCLVEFVFTDLNRELRKRLVPLQDALYFQDRLLRDFVKNGRADAHHIFCAEHAPVYTYVENKRGALVRPPADGAIEPLRAPLVEVNRAGGITFHGPGQIVFYLVLALDTFVLRKSIAEYVDEVVQKTLAEFGIRAHQKPPHLPEEAGGTWLTYCGVSKKIASRGITIKHLPRIGYVTTFGFGLNVNTDLTFFDDIYPCGLDIQMTSMREQLGYKTPLREVAKSVSGVIEETFSEKIEKAPSL